MANRTRSLFPKACSHPSRHPQPIDRFRWCGGKHYQPVPWANGSAGPEAENQPTDRLLDGEMALRRGCYPRHMLTLYKGNPGHRLGLTSTPERGSVLQARHCSSFAAINTNARLNYVDENGDTEVSVSNPKKKKKKRLGNGVLSAMDYTKYHGCGTSFMVLEAQKAKDNGPPPTWRLV